MKYIHLVCLTITEIHLQNSVHLPKLQLSSRIQQSPQHPLAPLASQDDSSSAGPVWRWAFCPSLAHLGQPTAAAGTAGRRAGQRGRDGRSMLGRDIGSGARGLSCPYFVSETSFFCSSCEPRNCVERVPDFVFGRTWAKDVSGPPHDPTRDSCGVYTPAPRPERRHPLAGHFQRGETASFPGQEFSQTPETRSFHFS